MNIAAAVLLGPPVPVESGATTPRLKRLYKLVQHMLLIAIGSTPWDVTLHRANTCKPHAHRLMKHPLSVSSRSRTDKTLFVQEATAKIDEYARGMISGSGSTLFEELGLYYIGPIDGHNIDDLIAVLQGGR